ncbi:MAG: glycosyltransferase family 2 protein [Leptospiraceae bacterium]
MKSIPGLSACIITLNEQDNLPDCLRSLDFVSEIVIVDSGSRDNTQKIARAAGARLFKREFDNYIDQKNFAIQKARGPWILFLDADERIDVRLNAEIRKLFSASPGSDISRGSSPVKPEVRPSTAGYKVPRRTFYLGRWIRHSGWYPDYSIRLFRKGSGQFEGRTFHETVKIRGRAGKLHNPILHFSYRSIRQHLDVINRYSELFARERLSLGKRNGVLFSLGKGLIKFLTMYVWRLGFLDGRAGLVIAVLGSYYNFLKYIKVWEYSRRTKASEH